MTLVVNLFGGPGIGKSTAACRVLAILKERRVNAELVTEHAKDLTWEEAHNKLKFEPLVIGEQMWRLERLRGKVDVIVTDSPVLLGTIYGKEMPFEWYQWLYKYVESWENLNVLLERGGRFYNQAGRNQTAVEANELDNDIRRLVESLKGGPPLVKASATEADALGVAKVAELRVAAIARQSA